jgi:subtilisin family serine protease
MVIFKDNSAVHAHINRQVYANELEKASDVISTLKNFAEVSQSGAVEILKANPRTASAFKTFWISNTMFIDGADAVTINHLVSLPEVLEVREQKIAHINPVIVNKVNADPAPLAEWGIEITNADLVHQSGNTGEGVVVSSIDTGVRYTHEALVGNYLNNGYSW